MSSQGLPMPVQDFHNAVEQSRWRPGPMFAQLFQQEADWVVDIADAQSGFGSTRQRCHAEAGAGVSERG